MSFLPLLRLPPPPRQRLRSFLALDLLQPHPRSLDPTLNRSLRRSPSIRRFLSTTVTSSSAINDDLTTAATPSTSLLTLTPSTLNTYSVLPPPTPAELKTAQTFFTKHAPQMLYAAAHFREFPPSAAPEVCFLGRSNVGKSSLLNALLGRPNDRPAHVSRRPGRTRTMNGFGVGGDGIRVRDPTARRSNAPAAPATAWTRFGRGGLVVVDTPGYGAGSRTDWGTEVLKYLSGRRQLRRTYVLVDAEHGLKSTDAELLVHLRSRGVPHQLVLTKVDKLLQPRAKPPAPETLHRRLLALADVRERVWRELEAASERALGRSGAGLLGDVLCVSAEKTMEREGHRRIGINELRWSVLASCGLQDSVDSARRKSAGAASTLQGH